MATKSKATLTTEQSAWNEKWEKWMAHNEHNSQEVNLQATTAIPDQFLADLRALLADAIAAVPGAQKPGA